MRDREGDLAQGRTRWRRFAVLAGASTVAVGGILFAMSTGAIAASFAVSGQTFTVTADKLVGDGFVQYGGLATESSGAAHPVAISGIKSAKLYNLCQSVKVPNLPVVLVIKAGGDPAKPAEATDLLIDMDSLSGDATFDNINIGQDAATLNAAGPNAHGQAGAFGQQATHVQIDNLQQIARATSAGQFKLTGLKLNVNIGANAKECPTS